MKNILILLCLARAGPAVAQSPAYPAKPIRFEDRLVRHRFSVDRSL